ncbi:FAD-dependent oxidoreductase [Pluralibacter gergoviae]
MAHKKWLCIICGFIYDEEQGWPDDGIAPGTAWEDVPETWACPECLVGKADFEMIEISDEVAQTLVSVAAAPTPAADLQPVVIIGSGHAGYQLAAALRALSPTLPVTVFTADDGAIYSKPMLSCALEKNKTAQGLQQYSALEWEQALGVRLYPHARVHAINRQAKQIETSIGTYPYGRLVLATGADPIRPAIAGDPDALLSINNLADYRRFRTALADKRHVTLLGDGLIGCEFAHDLAQAGYDVTVVGLGRWPMSTQLPRDVGEALQQSLSALGVQWCLNTTATAVARCGENDAWQLTLSNGQRLLTDAVISAVGLRPNTALADGCGLEVGKGIRVNACGQTGDEAIFALGDCAEYPGGWRPYIAPINQVVPALAKSLTGLLTPVAHAWSPTIVKTPCMPLSFHPATRPGQWHSERHGGELMAFHYDDSGTVTGFALLGSSVQQHRGAWMAALLGADSVTSVTDKELL